MQKKIRNMTLKGFFHRATISKSPQSFIANNLNYIENDSALRIILSQYNNQEISCEDAFSKMKEIAFEKVKAEGLRSLNVKNERAVHSKRYIATIMHGNVEGESKSFDMMQDAERWSDRNLAYDASTTHASIESNFIGAQNISWTIDRADAIARTFKRSIGPACRTISFGSKLSFGVKAKGDLFYFSKG